MNRLPSNTERPLTRHQIFCQFNLGLPAFRAEKWVYCLRRVFCAGHLILTISRQIDGISIDTEQMEKMRHEIQKNLSRTNSYQMAHLDPDATVRAVCPSHPGMWHLPKQTFLPCSQWPCSQPHKELSGHNSWLSALQWLCRPHEGCKHEDGPRPPMAPLKDPPIGCLIKVTWCHKVRTSSFWFNLSFPAKQFSLHLSSSLETWYN